MFRFFLLFLLLASYFNNLHAQLRGEIEVDIEPIYGGHADENYPLDFNMASRRAAEEAALFFSAMIYGWSFHYEIGERARQIEENIELELISVIDPDDPALEITSSRIRDLRLVTWINYRLSEAQERRMAVWRMGQVRNAQALGFAPAFFEVYPGWIAVRQIALDDAARAALRQMLRSSERNRPKEVKGVISLVSFPRYFIDGGRWTVSARFRVQIEEIIPYAVH